MKKLGILSSIACFLWYHSTLTNPVITLFVRAYPEQNTSYIAHATSKLKKPGHIAKQHTKRFITHATAGIFALYAGFIQVSNNIGQITFPRKHSKPSLHLIVTNKLKPIVMLANTIHHWEFEPSIPVAFYEITRNQDPSTDLFFWQVTQKTPPSDNIVPHDALVVITKPHYIFVPTGITITKDTPNLQLPDIYAKKGIDTTLSALYILNIVHFFSPVQLLYKKEATRLSSQPGN